ncbi:gephyrin-like molybdotransferase Glp [Undibacterium sp. RuRC25W]|uniref:molybdopterin molybdotransferase MoeA n=1 Tax=Undibacterium sp. RuRC25W TaxID=3413047 RepID=UPI003BF31103
MNQRSSSPTMRLEEISSQLPDYNPNALSVAMATEVISQFVSVTNVSETVDIRNALGRHLAEDIISPINVPSHDNSAMDGYAFGYPHPAEHPNNDFRIIGATFAGHPFVGDIQSGECVRIMTGAMIPMGCDTIVPQELTKSVTDSTVSIPLSHLRKGDNLRCAGEDLSEGKIALAQGKMLRPADLGLLASLGISKVLVRRRLRVAYFSTGDELRGLDETLDAGCIYDSNNYTLQAMLTRLGCDAVDMGIIKDDPAILEASFRQACESADIVITSGGVSVGMADYTKQVMAHLGDVAFWSIDMRPGKPMAFGKIFSDDHSAYLFGLPGNPVAVMVTFYFFVRPAILRMMGAVNTQPLMIPAISKYTIKKRPGRTEFQRGIASLNEGGELEVVLTGAQGSGMLRSMAEANCIIVLPHEQQHINAGNKVMLVLFEGLI